MPIDENNLFLSLALPRISDFMVGHRINMASSQSPKQVRTVNTRDLLMRAAEKLFADQGLENVSVRAIITEAGQKNESALQYHFTNRRGLIEAIQQRRTSQVNGLRRIQLDRLDTEVSSITVRQICQVLVNPAFELCRNDAGFRDFIAVFSQPALTSRGSMLSIFEAQEASIIGDVLGLLLVCLPDLDEVMLRLRFEDVITVVAQRISARVRSKGAFRGKKSDFFCSNLIDIMVAIFSAEVSAETAAFR